MVGTAKINRHSGARLSTWLSVAALLLVLLAPAPAFAHGDDEQARAFDLVRQAIALIVNTPGDQMNIEDKVADALVAEDTTDVRLDLVRQAEDALASGDLHDARALLERSIGARVHTSAADPVPIGQPPPLTGEQTGTLAAVDALPGRQELRGGEWLLLTASLLIGATGVLVAARIRPPHLPPQAHTKAAL
ncbi:hypothetical protein [Promicromonospora soli]